MKRRLFKLALVILAIVAVERTVFYTFIRQPILQQFRDTAERRYIDAIAAYNFRSEEWVLNVPTAIPNAQAMYEQAVAEIDPDTLPKYATQLTITRKIECFYRFYCVNTRLNLGPTSQGYNEATLQVIGLRPLTHISRILAPRAKQLDGKLAGKTINIARFSSNEETKWR